MPSSPSSVTADPERADARPPVPGDSSRRTAKLRFGRGPGRPASTGEQAGAARPTAEGPGWPGLPAPCPASRGDRDTCRAAGRGLPGVRELAGALAVDGPAARPQLLGAALVSRAGAADDDARYFPAT